MQTFGFVVVAIFAVGLAVSLLARRMNWPWAIELRALTQAVLFGGVAVILGYTAIRSVERGGWYYALAAVCVPTALKSLLNVVAMALVVLRLVTEPDTPE